MATRKRRPLDERFWSRVRKSAACWEWTGFRNANGYGHIRLPPETNQERGKRIGAHRASWLINVGQVPDGLEVMHRCDNPACVRPDHLRLGTHADNMRDMMLKGRDGHGRLVGANNHKAKLTDAQVIDIRRRYVAGAVRQKDLAIEYGVTQGLVGQIVANRIWRHI